MVAKQNGSSYTLKAIRENIPSIISFLISMNYHHALQYFRGGDYQNLPTEAVFAHLSGLSFVLFSTLVLYIVSHDGYKPVQSHSAEYRDVNNH